MGDNFVANVASGVIQRKVDANVMWNMRTALFLVSIDAQNRAPIKTGKLRSDLFRSVFKIGSAYFGIFIFKRSYAKYQHDGLTFNHPKGGEALFARKALWYNARRVMQILGRGAIS